MPQILLLLQDNAPQTARIRKLLSQSGEGLFVIEWLNNCAAVLDRLHDQQKKPIAAVLVDLSLPRGQGQQAFDLIIEASPHTPILVLSDREHEEAAKRAVQRGAQDYLLEDHLDSHSLSKALRNMMERAANAEALFIEKERALVTLNSIGDGVISTDAAGRVTYLNQVAEAMTGWASADALGRSFGEIFKMADNTEHAVNPMILAMQQNKTVGLAAGSTPDSA